MVVYPLFYCLINYKPTIDVKSIIIIILAVLKHKQCLFSAPSFAYDWLEVHLHIQGLVGLLMTETAILAFGDRDHTNIQKLRTEVK